MDANKSSTVNPPTLPLRIRCSPNDGKADLLFQNASTGAMAAWLMNGTAIRAQGIDLLAPTARTEVGSPRLNADTFPDVLLQDNASASLTTLLLTWSGTTPAITNGSVSGTLSPSQKVVSTADLDGDGKADVLFQDTNTGRLSYWLLNNSTVIATGVLPSYGDVSNWKVVGTPDLNRDGKADVLLQSASAPPRAKNPFGFVGKAGYYSDEESGLQLLGHRYYLPKLGRFLTQDPTGHDTGLNLYRYVGDNPLTGIDPDGTQGASAQTYLQDAWYNFSDRIMDSIYSFVDTIVPVRPTISSVENLGYTVGMHDGGRASDLDVLMATIEVGINVSTLISFGEGIGTNIIGRKAIYSFSGLVGTGFEDAARATFGLGNKIKIGKMEFDATLGSTVIEMKSGNYWLNHFNPGVLGEQISTAQKAGRPFEVWSNAPIPHDIQQWLTHRGAITREFAGPFSKIR